MSPEKDSGSSSSSSSSSSGKPAAKAAGNRTALLGIKRHRPIRRSESRGGCDLCGDPMGSDVHDGELIEVSSEADLERVIAIIPRHKDSTLCTRESCDRTHVGDTDDNSTS